MDEMKGKEKFEILLEDLKKDFKAAFDGIVTLRSETRRGFDEVKEKIEENSSAIKWVAKDVREIKEKLDAHIRMPAHM